MVRHQRCPLRLLYFTDRTRPYYRVTWHATSHHRSVPRYVQYANPAARLIQHLTLEVHSFLRRLLYACHGNDRFFRRAQDEIFSPPPKWILAE
jgi:hypothetical protein